MTSAKLLIRGKTDKNQEKLSVRIANFWGLMFETRTSFYEAGVLTTVITFIVCAAEKARLNNLGITYLIIW